MAEHVCPWWLGYFLASPLRRLWQKPEKILGEYVKEGMTVLEIGPGMGFFTLPLARMVGVNGRIVCADVQQRMLDGLHRRAGRTGLSDRIITIRSTDDSLQLDEFGGQIDFALAFAVVHEVPDQRKLFQEIYSSMKYGTLLLVAEPVGHVTADGFRTTIALAKQCGFELLSSPAISRSHSGIVKKN